MDGAPGQFTFPCLRVETWGTRASLRRHEQPRIPYGNDRQDRTTGKIERPTSL